MRWMPLSLAAIVILAAGCGGGGHKSSTTTTTHHDDGGRRCQGGVDRRSEGERGRGRVSPVSRRPRTARQLADLGAEYAKALQGTNSNDIKKTSAILKQFADKTPSAIRPSFETVAADYGKIADALQGVNVKQGSIPSPTVIAKLAKLGTEIDSAGLAKAETNIGTWAQKNCVAK